MYQLDGCVHRKFGTKVLEGLLCVSRVQERAQIAIRFAWPLEYLDREEVIFFGDTLKDARTYGAVCAYSRSSDSARRNSHTHTHTHTYVRDGYESALTCMMGAAVRLPNVALVACTTIIIAMRLCDWQCVILNTVP